uniref:Peptidase S1 domain-containing protein n=1 Tax=Gopherus agassizii TaxID=38772 RepID=A0A452H0N1_9SAUR
MSHSPPPDPASPLLGAVWPNLGQRWSPVLLTSGSAIIDPFLVSLAPILHRIIGGQEAQPHSRPYMAYLEIQHEDTKFRCGGFLVLENFVLTAKIPVRRRIPHSQYDKKTFNNDIMLPQLAKRAKLNGEVGTINLPLANERVEPGTVCSVTGGGSTRTECLLCPDTLQEADVMVMPDAQCPKDPYGSYDSYNPSTMMCGGDPAQCKDSSQVNLLLALRPCKAPGVYTKVSTFIPWIEKMMRKLQP